MSADVSRDIMLAALALKIGFVDKAALAAAVQEWSTNGQQPLDKFLVERGLLRPEQCLQLLRDDLLVRPKDTAAMSGPLTEYADTTPLDQSAPSVPAGQVSGVRRFQLLAGQTPLQGGLGRVSRARDLEVAGREVAFKEITTSAADDPEMRKMFLREAEITGRLEHPGIVPVYGMGQDDKTGRPYYVMRWIGGVPLRDEIERLHASESEDADNALRNLLERHITVCETIAFAHRERFVHCDIKPDNIMAGEFGETLVVDWGLAQPFPQVDVQPGSVAILPIGRGTPGYRSPEQHAGKPSAIAPASDIFSLGATLYHILAGSPPVDSSPKPLSQLRPGRVPTQLENICLKAMAADPEDRYDSALAVANAIRSWLSGRDRVLNLIEPLQTSELEEIPALLTQLTEFPLTMIPHLRRLVENSEMDVTMLSDDRRRRIWLALAKLGVVNLPILQEWLFNGDPRAVGLLCEELRPFQEDLAAFCINAAAEPSDQGLRGACALAAWPDIPANWQSIAYRILPRLLSCDVLEVGIWSELLRPVRHHFVPPLTRALRQSDLPVAQHSIAASLLADYASDEPVVLANQLAGCDLAVHDILFNALDETGPVGIRVAIDCLREIVVCQPSKSATDIERIDFGRRRADAAIALSRLCPSVELPHDLFRNHGDPETLTQFVHRAKPRGVEAAELAKRLLRSKIPEERFALLLALAAFHARELEPPLVDHLLEALYVWYVDDLNSSIHSAIRRLLVCWGMTDVLKRLDGKLPTGFSPERQWFSRRIGTQNITFTIFLPGTFQMGCVKAGEVAKPHERQIDRAFALSIEPVTVGQWKEFCEAKGGKLDYWEKVSPTDEHSVNNVSWQQAVSYCRWATSFGANVDLRRQCHTGKQEFHPERAGFRLPLEAEWEYACRSDTFTDYSFGSENEFLKYHGSLQRFTQCDAIARATVLVPNLRGLFGMHGGLYEWCQDQFSPYLDDSEKAGPVERVLRGGGWSEGMSVCRSAARHHNRPRNQVSDVGFRLACTLPSDQDIIVTGAT